MRILRLLLHLYPSAWRERYGSELRALLEDSEPRSRDVANIVWEALKMRLTAPSFLKIVAPCALLGLAVALAQSLRPPQFTSTAVLWVTSQPTSGACGPQEDLPPALQGPSQRACNDPVYGADQIAHTLIRPAFDQAFLTSIVEKMNLYPNERRSMSPDQVAKKLQANIHLLPLKPKDFTSRQYELQFSYPDPQLAQQVNALLIPHIFDPRRAKDWLPPLLVRHRITISLVLPPSLPAKPAGVSRPQRSMIGLAVGLLGGILTAKTFRLLGHAL